MGSSVWRAWVARHRSRPLAAMVLGVVLALPAVSAPLAGDDLFHVGSLEGMSPISVGWWELFTFVPADPGRRRALVEASLLPWWSAPDLHIAFFRPLSSGLITLDHALFGRAAIAWHVHSLLWWAALLAAAAQVLRRCLAPSLAALAFLLFVIDDSHWMPIVWPSARNGLVAVAPALLGLWAHLRWRQEGWRSGALLGPLGFAAGLGGGEAAVSMLAYVAAFELLDGAGDRWPRRLQAVAPYAALLVAYAFIRHAAGAGVVGSGIYLDPTSTPGPFLRAALVRVPVLVGNALLGIPAEVFVAARQARPLLIVVGCLSLGLLLFWLRSALTRLPDGDRRSLRWLTAGGLLSLVPGAGAMPGERLLLPASLGLAAALAVLLGDAVRIWREARAHGALVRRPLAGVLVALIALPNLVLAAPLLVAKIALWAQLGRQMKEQVCAPEVDSERPTHAVLAWTDQPPLAQFGGAARWFHCRGNLVSWTVLSSSANPQTLERVSERTLRLRTLGQPLLAGTWEILFRSADVPVRVGDTVTQAGGLRTTVEAVHAGRPTRVRFDFPGPIESDRSDHRLYIWQSGDLRPLPLPTGGVVAIGKKLSQ